MNKKKAILKEANLSSVKEIAEKYNISANTIYNWRSSLKNKENENPENKAGQTLSKLIKNLNSEKEDLISQNTAVRKMIHNRNERLLKLDEALEESLKENEEMKSKLEKVEKDLIDFKVFFAEQFFKLKNGNRFGQVMNEFSKGITNIADTMRESNQMVDE